MIDYIKFSLPPGVLDACSRLQFEATVITETGELDPWKTAAHGPFAIRVHSGSGYAEVKGSLAKYTSGSHNGGEFYRWQVGQAVQQLASELGFKPSQAQLHSVEFGVNVPLRRSAKRLLRRVLLHAGKGGSAKVPDSKFNQRGLLREVEAQQYFFKAYDKEAQLVDAGFDVATGPMLRVEVKARKMQLLKAAGVATLADLDNPAALEAMGQLLVAQWNSLVFAPPGKLPPTLRTTERRLLQQASKPGYWEELPAPMLRAQVKKYRRLVAQHVEDAEHTAATQGLLQTWQKLLEQPRPAHSSEVLVNPLSRGVSTAFPEKNEKKNTTDNNSQNAQPLPPPRCCQTCGRPIGTGNATAKFCSTKEVGPAAAKKCRNADSNPRNNARRTLRKIESQPLLFDTRPYVRVPAQVQEYVLAA